MANKTASKVEWIGEKVDPYIAGLVNTKVTFYNGCQINNNQFSVGDFALMRTRNNVYNNSVVRLMGFYESHEPWNASEPFRGKVKHYMWARKLPLKIRESQLFDVDNEVVENSSCYDVLINLELIVKKCSVYIASRDDPVYFVKKNNLDPCISFSCRYTLQHEKLLPIINTISVTDIGTPTKQLRLENENTPMRSSRRKRKQVLRDDDLMKLYEENLTTTPTKSPRPRQDLAVVSVEKNAHVKRNLGESFGSPTILRNLSNSLVNCPTIVICNSEGEDNNKPPKCNDERQLVINLSPLHPEVLKMKSPIKLQSIGEFVDVTHFNSNVSKLLFDDSLPCEVIDPLADPLAECNSKCSKKISSARPKHKNNGKASEGSNKHVRHSSRQIDDLIVQETDDALKDPLEDCHKNTNSSRSKQFSSVNSNYKPNIMGTVESNKSNSRKNNDLIVDESTGHSVSSIQTKSKKDVEDTNQFVRRTSRQVKRVSYVVSENVEKSVRRSSRQVKRVSYAILSSDNEESKMASPILLRNRRHNQVPKEIELTSFYEEKEEKGDIVTPLKPSHRCSTRLASRSESELLTKPKPDSVKGGATRSSARITLKTGHEEQSSKHEPTPLKDECVALSRPRRSIRPSINREIFSTFIDIDTDFSSSDSYAASDSLESDSESDLSSPEEPIKARAAKKLKNIESEDELPMPATPKRKLPFTPRGTPKNTPRHKARLIKEGLITPVVPARSKAIVKADTPLAKAKNNLHVSYVPKVLPCRENEFTDILNFIEGRLYDGQGGCMYISGVPGTGKTATVTEVIRTLQEYADNKEVPQFTYININGMRLSEPRQAYVEMVKQLTDKTVPWDQAQNLLNSKFCKSDKKIKPTVLIVDELDILCTKRQDVVYNLLDWPTKVKAQLIVITIANTMDLPERLLMGRITSRLGLTRLTFKPYTYTQLQKIVMKRLSGMDAFNPEAVEFVARKVASVSGDARRALDICRRSAEIAELEGPDALVTIKHVNKAISAMMTQPKVLAIKHCNRLEKLILQSVVAEVERTGIEETNFKSVYAMLESVAAIEGFKIVSHTVMLAALARLGSSRLLLTDQKCFSTFQRILLNVSVDDIHYALKC